MWEIFWQFKRTILGLFVGFVSSVILGDFIVKWCNAKLKEWRLSIKVVIILVCVPGVILGFCLSIEDSVDIINRITSLTELSLLSTDIDYFSFKLSDNAPFDCIDLYSREQFPNLNFQLGNRYFKARYYKSAIKEYDLAVKYIESFSGEGLKEFILKKFDSEELRTMLRGGPLIYEKAEGNEDIIKKIRGLLDRITPNENLINILNGKEEWNCADEPYAKKLITDKLLEIISEPKRFLWAVYYNMAISYEAIGNDEEAVKYAEKCSAINLNAEKNNALLERLKNKTIH